MTRIKKYVSLAFLTGDVAGCIILAFNSKDIVTAYLNIFRILGETVKLRFPGKIVLAIHPYVYFFGFIALAMLLLIKEAKIKNTTVSLVINVIVAVILSIAIPLYFNVKYDVVVFY